MASVDARWSPARRLPGLPGPRSSIGSVTFPACQLASSTSRSRRSSCATTAAAASPAWSSGRARRLGRHRRFARRRRGLNGTSTTGLRRHEDAIVGVAAETVELTIGDSSRRRQLLVRAGRGRAARRETIGLSTAELTRSARRLRRAAAGRRSTGGSSRPPAITTLIGIGGATVFAGYAPNGFLEDPTFTCAELEAAHALGFCADGIDFGISSRRRLRGSPHPRLPAFWPRAAGSRTSSPGLPDVRAPLRGPRRQRERARRAPRRRAGRRGVADGEASFPEGDGDPAPPAGLRSDGP